MIDEQKLLKGFDDFDAAVQTSGAAAGKANAAALDPCATWNSVKGTVDIIITGLRAAGTLFPIAKRAADVLETLKTLLNALCGGS